MTQGHRRSALRAALMMTAALTIGSRVSAQQFEGAVVKNETGVPEIIVTAQKRSQSLQSVGLSVTALGGKELSAIGRQDLTALAAHIPNLQVNQYSPTETVFNIRGVSQNDFSDSQEAPIAFYNDEVYVSALGAISGLNFDLERVEVLRGPQGTLFGRNATGGLVQIISAKPTKDLDIYAILTGGSYGQFATEAAISGPLNDHVRARFAFTSDRHNGYIKNRIGPDLGNSRFYAGRFQVAADVGSTGKLSIKFQALRNDHETSGGLYSFVALGANSDGLGFKLGDNQVGIGPCPGCDGAGYREPDNNPFTGSFDKPGFFDRKYWSATARYEQKVGKVDVTSITDYQDLRKRYGEDSDASPLPTFGYDTYQKLYQISQELRASHSTARFEWILGLYGLIINQHNDFTVDTRPSFGLFDQYGGKQLTQSLAAFGQGEYNFTPSLSFIFGARYSWDRKRDDFSHTENGVTDVVFNTNTYPVLAQQTYKNWSGKGQINYKPTANILLYVGVNRGTKSGGFGVQAFSPIDPTTLPYGQEALTNFEGGAKVSLPNLRTTLNASVFHYKYDGYQAFTYQGFSQFITNKRAHITGAEIELNTRPVEGLQFGAFATYLESKIDGIVLPSGRIVDRKLPQAPSLSIGANLRYDQPIGAYHLVGSTDWKYDSSQFFSTFNSPIDYEPGRVVGNVRLELRFPRDQWSVALFANNVTDKWYRIYNLDNGGTLGSADQTYARPRWLGGSVSFRLK